MGNKIVLKTESDVTLSNYTLKPHDLYHGDTFKFSSKQVGDSYVSDITVEKNMRTNERKIAVGVAAQYKGKNIETPFITITQQAHPKYYVEGETKVSKDYFDEFGGVFTVSTYAKKEDYPNHVVNSDYFNIIIEGGENAVTNISEPIETEEALLWTVTIGKNTGLEERTLYVRVNFDDKNDSTWSSNPLTVTQSAHVPVKTHPVFSVSQLLVDYTGGDIMVTSYYSIDGVQMPINPVSVVDSTFTEGTDYIFSETADTMTRTLRILKNESEETPNGEPNKSMYLKIQSPLDGSEMKIGPIRQKTKKQGTYEFNFTNGTIERKIIKPFSYNEQDFEIGIVSLKRYDDNSVETLGVTCTYSNVGFFSGQPEFDGSVLKFHISENTGKSRACTVTIKQYKEDGQTVTMPDLKLHVSQFAKEEEGALPYFDYMIMTVASDMFGGMDLDTMVYANDMPSDYMYYKCVGSQANEYLSGVEFQSAPFQFTDYGDTKNNTLRWAGDNTMVGAESFLMTSRNFMTEAFVLSQMKAGETEFDVDVYCNFADEKYTGISTIRVECYNSDNGAVIIDNPYAYGSSIFKPDELAIRSFADFYNVRVSSEGSGKGEYFKDDGGYTKIGTFKYMYSTCIWHFALEDSVIPRPKESEKDAYREEIEGKKYLEKIWHMGSSKLNDEYLFGCLYDMDGSQAFDLFTLGSTGECHINSDNMQHAFYMFSLYYDQTRYQITKFAILGPGLSPKDSDWIDQFYKGLMAWHTLNNGNDDCLWIYWKETDSNEPETSSLVERSSYHIGTPPSTVPKTAITGQLYDPDTNITSQFTIDTGSTDGTGTRRISWKDTANGDTSVNKYVVFKSIDYDHSGRRLLGVEQYSTVPLYTSVKNFIDFKYYYNSVKKNILFKWGEAGAIVRKIVEVYVHNTTSSDLDIDISYGFSDIKNVEPLRWASAALNASKPGNTYKPVGQFTVVKEPMTYLWFKISASNSSESYGPCKVWELFNAKYEYIAYTPTKDECYISEFPPSINI